MTKLNTTVTILAVALVVSAAGLVQADQGFGAEPIAGKIKGGGRQKRTPRIGSKGTDHAFLLRIDYSHDYIPLLDYGTGSWTNPRPLVSLLNSLEPAAIKDAGYGGDDPVWNFQVVTEFEGGVTLRISVDCESDSREVSSRLLSAMTFQLGQSLKNAYKSFYDSRMIKRKASKDATEREYTLLMDAVMDLRKKAMRTDLSLEGLLESLSDIEGQLQDIEMEHAGLSARRDAIVKQVAEVEQAMKQRMSQDPVAKELGRMIQLRQSRLDRLRKERPRGIGGGRRTVIKEEHDEDEIAEEIEFIEEELAEGRAELGAHELEMQDRLGGELLAELNSELVTLTIEAAELEARQRLLQERLSMAKQADLMQHCKQFEIVSMKLEAAREAYERAIARDRELAEYFETLIEPKVTILGGQ